MARHDRPRALTTAALVTSVLALVLPAGCSDEPADRTDDADRDRPDILEPDRDTDEVGRLVPHVVSRSPVNPDAVEGPVGELPPPLRFELTTLNTMVVAPEGALWLFAQLEGQTVVLKVDGNQLDSIDVPDDLAPGSDIAVGPDDTVYFVSESGDLLRYRNGQITPIDPGDGEIQDMAAAADGTVYVADHPNQQIVALAPDGSTRTAVTGAEAGPMATGPDGTLYYYDEETEGAGMQALAPNGEIRQVTGRRDDEPTEGALAIDVALTAVGMAVTDDGIYTLHRNTIWRINHDGRLELVLRRRWHRPPAGGPDDNDIRLRDMAAGGDQIYVWDQADDGVVYRAQPDE